MPWGASVMIPDPHGSFGGFEYGDHQEDQDDADQHHLDLSEGLVDHRRKRDYQTDDNEQPDGDVAVKILVDAECEGDRRG
jgi:hypothetical protein